MARAQAVPPCEKGLQDGENRQRALLRAALYRCLAALLLAPPRADALETLFSADGIGQIRWLLGDGIAEKIQSLAVAGRDVVAADPRVGRSESDRQEFFDLLAVPTARYLTPFESVYCGGPMGDGDNRVAADPRVGRGLSTRAVEQAYSEAGFQLTAKELPDHAGCELAFLAELCLRESEALDAGTVDSVLMWRASQGKFLRHHAGRWLGRLSRRLEGAASAPYLKALAILMQEQLRSHEASLAQIPQS